MHQHFEPLSKDLVLHGNILVNHFFLFETFSLPSPPHKVNILIQLKRTYKNIVSLRMSSDRNISLRVVTKPLLKKSKIICVATNCVFSFLSHVKADHVSIKQKQPNKKQF